MNCREGDLAVVVRSHAGNEGRIVRCVRLVMGNGALGYGPRWVTEPPLYSDLGWVVPPLDVCLRPIRDNDGEDESFSWAGKPQGVTA